MPTAPKLTKHGRPRDTQRQKVYESTWAALDRTGAPPPSAAGQRLLYGGAKVPSTGSVSIEACQAYVNWLTEQAWFQRRWGRRHFTVKHKVYGSATHTFGTNWVTLPPWARKEWVILHEVAHALIGRHDAPHGPQFAAINLVLVRFVLGDEAHARFLAEMRAHRVKRDASAVPEPKRAVVTKTAVVERERAAAKQPVTRREAEGTAAVIRRAVKQGHLGAVGTKQRAAALAVARELERLSGEARPIAANR